MIQNILAKRPTPTVADGLTTQQLGKPDTDLTFRQYDAYLEALRGCGLTVTVLPANPVHPDGHYVEDPAVLYQSLAFIGRSPTPSRAIETDDIINHLADFDVVRIEGDEATLEGGDVLFCANGVLIGLSKRTNRAGAKQLKHAIQSISPNLPVDFVPLSGVLHLKTGMTELAPGIFLKNPEMETDFVFDAQVITLPAEEGYAANVLPINDSILIATGYPTVMKLAHEHYEKVCELDMSEFKKMDGSLTCLSLRY